MTPRYLFETPFRSRSGIYWVRRWDRELKKRTTLSTRERTKREAKEIVRRWEEEASMIDIRVRQLALLYRRHELEGRAAESTIENFDVSWRLRWLPALGGMRLSEVEPRHIQEAFARYLEYDQPTPETAKLERQQLRAVFRYGWRSQLLGSDPSATLRGVKVPPPEVRVWTREEMDHIERVARERTPPWFLFYLQALRHSGLRGHTVRALERRDIDWEGRRFQVPAEKLKMRARHEAVMSDEAYTALRRAMVSSLHPKLLFPQATRRAVERLWDRIQARGVKGAPHMYRSTFITELARAGADPKLVMSLSGHRDLATILRHYRAISPQEQRLALKRRQAVEAEDRQLREAEEG